MKSLATEKRYAGLAALFAALGPVHVPPALAQPEDAATAPAKSAGLVPIPDYSGDWSHRAFWLGDPGGFRSDWADKGIQFNVDWVQTVQSIVDGGRDTGTKYGGSLDYRLTLDLDRMGVMPGAMVKFRGETRYGASVNDMSGSLLPVNTDGFFPLGSPPDDAIPFTITELSYYQFLSERFGLVVGKLQTLDSDLNEFASGRGNSQFMNTQLVFSGTMSLLPYSTLGGGVFVMPTKNVSITSMVMNLTDSSTTSGFNDIGDGAAWSTEAPMQYQLGKLPGGTNVGGIYMWDSQFFNFGGRFTFSPGEGIVPPANSDTWIAYASGWQYVFCKEPGDGPLDLTNGEPDREGFGVFWRAAIADDDVNPSQWSLSGGGGGKGMIPTREQDFFGVGYYYNSVQTTRLSGVLGLDDHTQGFECFYNIALTPASQLTLDAQLIDSAGSDLDTAVVLGMRLEIQL